MTQIAYDHEAAVAYARQWAQDRNKAYADFGNMGGDCTNFVSQCLYAGCGVMNYTPDAGWFYISLQNRSAAWSGVEFLYRFLTRNQNAGSYGHEIPLGMVQPGDIIQLRFSEGAYTHSLFAVETGQFPTPDNILVCAHSIDSYNRRLSSYTYRSCRAIHIDGARK